MSMKFRSCSLFVVGVFSFGVTLFPSLRTDAALETFTIDSSQSQISLSGIVAGSTLTAQGPGGLTTTYSGDIKADVSDSAIQFGGGSSIVAATNGVWQPAVGGGSGAAAADYGGQVLLYGFLTGYGAARNIVLDLNSSSLILSGTNFDSTALVFSFANDSNSSFDYNASITSGSQALSGQSTNSVANGASISSDGVTQTLLIKFNTPFTYSLIGPNDTTLILSGQIVATNSVSVSNSPFINSFDVSGQTAVLQVQNASLESQLQSSTNLMDWTPASATTQTNAGTITFTAPATAPQMFFRVQQ